MTAETSAAAEAPPAISARGALVGLLAIALFINYIDRGNLATAASLIKSDLHLTTVQLGFMTSAFFWTYTPGQFVAGWVADKLGGYRALGFGFAIWSIATALTGFAGGFASLLGLRVLLGMGECTAFPSLSKLLAENLPPEKLGMANGFIISGLAFGPAFGTLAGGMILATLGWRTMFILFGFAAMLWLVPWFVVARRVKPERKVSASIFAPPPPVGEMLRQRSLWGACLGHFSVNYALYFVLSWLPLWLVQQRGFSIVEMAKLGAAVYCVYGACVIVTGWLTDLVIARGASITVVRKTVTVLSHLGVAVGLAGCAVGSPTVVIASLFLCGVFLGLNSIWPISQTLAGPRAAAKWVGIQNGIANTAGIIVPIVTGFIVDRTGSFDAAFIVAAVVALLGAVGWGLILGPVEPVRWQAAR
jgi:MFS family permease